MEKTIEINGISVNIIPDGQTNFDYRISREEAERQLNTGIAGNFGFSIMCKEYGDDEDWVGVTEHDMEGGQLAEEWQTFEIWV